MSTRRIVLGFLVCFLIAVFVGQTLSQTRNVNRKQRQQELERRRLKQQLERQLKKQIGPAKSEKELMKQVLRATEKQWKAIKLKLDKVRELRNRANVSIMCVGGAVGVGVSGMGGSSVVDKGVGRGSMSGSMSGSGFGGTGTLSGGQKRGSAGGSLIHYSWGWVRPSRHKGFENLDEGEKICEELFRLLEDKNSELEEIRQKMEALQKFRQEAKKELAIAQQELRKLVTPHQEAALVMMQLLD
jgi:CHASE3 domain sensor protein